MNTNSSIPAARLRSRPWKQALRGLPAVPDRQFERRLSELTMRANMNLTFMFALFQDEHENGNA